MLTNRKNLFIASLLSMAATMTCSSTAQATHAWGNYHWARTANPFILKLADNVNSTWDGYLQVASTDWTTSAVLDTSIIAGTKDPKTCKPTAGRVEVCNAAYGARGWLGIAQIWASGDHITQGTAKMNDSYFNTATYNTPAWRQLVMCQEVAHTFGLGHQDEGFSNPNLNTCMDYTNSPETNQHPNTHDYDQLATIYSHTDSTTTLSATALSSGSTNQGLQKAASVSPALSNFDTSDPANWGVPIHASHGRYDVYERDFGNGQKMYTFVTWAEQ